MKKLLKLKEKSAPVERFLNNFSMKKVEEELTHYLMKWIHFVTK